MREFSLESGGEGLKEVSVELSETISSSSNFISAATGGFSIAGFITTGFSVGEGNTTLTARRPKANILSLQ